MTRDEAVAEIKEGLGFRTDLDERIIAHLRRVQGLLEQGKTLPWFLIVESFPLVVPAGASAALPEGFIREVDYGNGLYYTGTGNGAIFLTKRSLDEAHIQFGTAATAGNPKVYVLGSGFRLFPPLAVGTTLYFDYYKHAADLATNNANSWLDNAPYVLVGNAGVSIASVLDNARAVKLFTDLSNAATSALRKEIILREEANRARILGRNS